MKTTNFNAYYSKISESFILFYYYYTRMSATHPTLKQSDLEVKTEIDSKTLN